jgi:hypothetical protein
MAFSNAVVPGFPTYTPRLVNVWPSADGSVAIIKATNNPMLLQIFMRYLSFEFYEGGGTITSRLRTFSADNNFQNATIVLLDAYATMRFLLNS